MINTLDHPDIDVIINVSYFPGIYSASSFSYLDAYLYKIKSKNPVLILTRVNNNVTENIDQDETRNFEYSFQYSDKIIFISNYLKEDYEKAYGKELVRDSIVIHNGGDEKTFYPSSSGNPSPKIKIVTHHWSDHMAKGHDIYQKIDRLLDKESFREKFSFTYIGNIPSFLKYKNTEIIKPINGKILAACLRLHSVYITASQNEPAGMHHIEGALSGLPLLYVNSGALPEYCCNYGIEFNSENLEEKLHEIRINYEFYAKKLLSYQFKNTIQLITYVELFGLQQEPAKINYYPVLWRKYCYDIKYRLVKKMRLKLRKVFSNVQMVL